MEIISYQTCKVNNTKKEGRNTLEQARGPLGDAQDSQSDATHGAPQDITAP